jgi:transcriptional regulator with XRE-family HTH domain
MAQRRSVASKDRSVVGVSVGEVIREGRNWHGGILSLRQLAEKAGISASQLSRIEGGKVQNLSIEALGKVARGLNRDPRLLLIISGHIAGEEARLILKEKVKPGTELIEEWAWQPQKVEEYRAMLDDPQASDEAIKTLAAEVFQTWVDETLWLEGYLLPLMAQSDDKELLDLVETFRLVRSSFAEDRAKKIVEYAHDQLELARLEDPETFAQEPSK